MKKHLFIIILAFLCYNINAQTSGGPDLYGYTWKSNNHTVNPPTYSWFDITTIGTPVTGLADDNFVGPFSCNGFQYYWYPVTQFWIGSNGYISFSPQNIASPFPASVPLSSGANDWIAPLMSDLNFTGNGNTASCYYYANSDTICVSFINVPFWINTSTQYTGSNTFQIILNKIDKSITFNYLSTSLGAVTAIDNIVGIENNSGNLGLSSLIDQMPTNTSTRKFYYPTTVTYAVTDGGVDWNGNIKNAGYFIQALLDTVSLSANVKNFGNQNLGGFSVKDTVRNSSNVAITSGSLTIPLLGAGDDTLVNFSNPFIAPTAGTYKFNTAVSGITGDMVLSNNYMQQEIVAVNTAQTIFALDYSDGVPDGGGIGWSGGDGGIAVYIEPPVYPAQIMSSKFYISANATIPVGFHAMIYDDNGANGGHGTLLDSVYVAPTSITTGVYTTVLPASSNIIINSGGVYLVWLMDGPDINLARDLTQPISRQTYEIVGGGWSEYRDLHTEDFLMGLNIKKLTLEADFYADIANSPTVQFTDSSTLNPTSWLWDFGVTGATSTLQNPVYTYPMNGNYTVCLTATNANGSDSVCKTVSIYTIPPDAGFIFDTVNSPAIIFTDTSLGPTSWFWDFGITGATSTLQNPTYIYSANGNYNVCLKVTNPAGIDSVCQTVAVTAVNSGLINNCDKWQSQFLHDSLSLISSAGCETDGNYFYVTKWSGSLIWKLDMSGNLVDSFSISGVTGLRDLTYDGTYFYGGNSGNAIYKMNFNSNPPSLVSTIPSFAVTVRNISYDPTANNNSGAFWVGNWSTNFYLVSRTGTVLDTILATNHGGSSIYGTAFDNISPGGPYLWMINANGNVPTEIKQIKISTGLPTGVSHNCENDICLPGDLGGGLWIQPNLVAGTTTLGGLIQGKSIFGYYLSTTIQDSIDLKLASIDNQILNREGSTITISTTIQNKGLAVANSFTLNYSINGGSIYSTVFNSPTYNNNLFIANHQNTWTPQNSGFYSLKVWISNVNGVNADVLNCNDTITKVIRVIPAHALYEGFDNSGFPPSQWKIIDADNDGKNWFNPLTTNAPPSSQGKILCSSSWESVAGALSPNNHLITPRLSPVMGDSISFYYTSTDIAYPAEHYGILISKTGNNAADFTDTLYQETLTASVAGWNWQYKSLSLSQYVGDTIYISFNHYNCYNQNQLLMDEVVGPAPFKYVMTFNDTICNGDTLFWNNLDLTSAGIYNDSLMSMNGLDSIVQLNLYVKPLPPAVVTASGSTTICDGSFVSLQANNGLYTYSWMKNGIPIPYFQSTMMAGQVGNYSVIVTDTSNSFGCSSESNMISVSVNPSSFNVSFAANPTSFTAPPYFTVFYNQTPNSSNYSWNWLFGDGGSSAQLAPTYTYLSSGQYSVSAIATDIATGCSDTLVKSGYIICTSPNPCPVIAEIYPQGPVTICANDSFLLHSVSNNASYNYQWLYNGVQINGATDSIFWAKNAGNYKLMVSDTCTKYSSDFILYKYQLNSPIINASGIITPCSNDSLLLYLTNTYSSYQWSTGQNTPSIYVKSSGQYIVTVIDANSCSYTSPTYLVNASLLQTPEICIVGIDSATNNNRIIWQRQANPLIDSFRIYRESSVANQYQLIGSKAYSDQSMFIDVNSNPAQQAYRYKITAIDTCGAETPMSDFHKTNHLTINAGLNNTWNLIWDGYQGFSFGSYRIYRGADSLNLQFLTQIQSTLTSFTDLNPPTGNVYYQIEVVSPNDCYPDSVFNKAKTNYNTSRSNVANTSAAPNIGFETANSDGLSFRLYPNPNDGNFTFEVAGKKADEMQIHIYNTIGAEVYTETFSVQGRVVKTLKLNQLAQGVYLLHLTTENNIDYRTKIVIQR